MFALHKNNLAQIRAIVEAYGSCTIHGCGNMYVDKESSDLRVDFSNPGSDEATYRVTFKKGDKIPDTIEELERMLFEAKNKETRESREIKETTNVKTIVVPVENDSEEDSESENKKPGRKPKEKTE